MRGFTLAVAGIGLSVVAGPASALESFKVPFENILPITEPSESSIDPYVDDFIGTFEADSTTSTSIRLRLENNTSTTEVGDAFIGSVYFDHDGILTNFVVNVGNDGIVNFESLANLSMAQDNKISPPFEAETAYTRSTPPGTANAVQSGEALGFTADLTGGWTFGFFESQMKFISPIPVRIGMRIQGIDDEFSDSIVSGKPLPKTPIIEQPIPVPAALPLAATAMFGLGWFARRRRKAA